jgi:fatty acid desaturase
MTTKAIQIYQRNAYSPIADRVIFFGALVGLFYVNQAYLDSAVPEWILAILFIMGVITILTKAITNTTFTDPDEAKAFIDDFYSEPQN